RKLTDTVLEDEAVTVIVPDPELVKVTVFETCPLLSDVELELDRIAAPTGDTLHVTAWPANGFPALLSTSATRGFVTACPGFAVCPVPLIVFMDAGVPGET